jgi:hypothetical protein
LHRCPTWQYTVIPLTDARSITASHHIEHWHID